MTRGAGHEWPVTPPVDPTIPVIPGAPRRHRSSQSNMPSFGLPSTALGGGTSTQRSERAYGGSLDRHYISPYASNGIQNNPLYTSPYASNGVQNDSVNEFANMSLGNSTAMTTSGYNTSIGNWPSSAISSSPAPVQDNDHTSQVHTTPLAASLFDHDSYHNAVYDEYNFLDGNFMNSFADSTTFQNGTNNSPSYENNASAGFGNAHNTTQNIANSFFPTPVNDFTPNHFEQQASMQPNAQDLAHDGFLDNFEYMPEDLSQCESQEPSKSENNDDEFMESDSNDSDYVADGSTTKRKLKAGKASSRKVPRTNKDGMPRKPRDPRPFLMKWDDNDYVLALIGIVHACGEIGVPIPFAQAAQSVNTACTASALQQAILKLQSRLNNEGHQLPKLKMHWPKKSNCKNNADTRDFTKAPRRKPTLRQATSCHIITLKRAYSEGDRIMFGQPHDLTTALAASSHEHARSVQDNGENAAMYAPGDHAQSLASTVPMYTSQDVQQIARDENLFDPASVFTASPTDDHQHQQDDYDMAIEQFNTRFGVVSPTEDNMTMNSDGWADHDILDSIGSGNVFGFGDEFNPDYFDFDAPDAN